MMENLVNQIRKTGVSVGISQSFFTPTIRVLLPRLEQGNEVLDIIIKALKYKTFKCEVMGNNSEIWYFSNENTTILKVYIIKAYVGYKGMYED